MARKDQVDSVSMSITLQACAALAIVAVSAALVVAGLMADSEHSQRVDAATSSARDADVSGKSETGLDCGKNGSGMMSLEPQYSANDPWRVALLRSGAPQGVAFSAAADRATTMALPGTYAGAKNSWRLLDENGDTRMVSFENDKGAFALGRFVQLDDKVNWGLQSVEFCQ